MGLCEFCSRFDFREVALVGSGLGNEEWTQKWEESDGSSCCVEHHKDLAEFEQCALNPSGCDLCLLFFVTLGRHQKDLHYDSESESEQSIVGEDSIEKAKKFLQLRPSLMGRPLYIGPAQMELSFHQHYPGIGLWVEKDMEDNWSGTSDTDNETWHLLSCLNFFFKRGKTDCSTIPQ